MNKMKKISIVWGFLAFFLIGSLWSIAIIYNKKVKKYKNLENKLVELTKKYTANSFDYPKNKKSIYITYSDLKDEGLIKELKVKDKKCNGYVEVTNNKVIEYKAYIDCNVYKTHGFEKKHLK